MSNPALRGQAGAIAVIACALTLQSCASNSQSRLDEEAHRLLRPSMKLAEAERVLQRVGFNCESYNHNYIATCTRLRNYAVVATCVQRINLSADETGRAIARFDVPPPACASL